MMGRPSIPHRLCAVWPDHGAATEVAKLDGRMFHVCPGCAGGSVIVDKARPAASSALAVSRSGRHGLGAVSRRGLCPSR